MTNSRCEIAAVRVLRRQCYIHGLRYELQEKEQKERMLAKKLAGPGPDEYANWYPRWVADGMDPNWMDKLTPAERRQYEAEDLWAIRAQREDLPGPQRIGDIIVDFEEDFWPAKRKG